MNYEWRNNILMSKHIWFNRLKLWWLINFKNIFSIKNIFWSILTIYVLSNWEKCISMEFFKSFNGNNILFIVWILMIIVNIYDIEIKGFKMSERKQEIDMVNSKFEVDNVQQANLMNYRNEMNTIQQKIESDKILNNNSNREDIE